MLLRSGSVFIGEQYPPGHFGIALSLAAQGAKAIGAHPFAQLRVVLRAAEVTGEELPLVGQDRLVDEPDQAVQVYDILLDGRSGEKQLKGISRDSFECPRLLIALLVNGGEGVGLLKHRQIPRDGFGRFLIAGGKLVCSDDDRVL